MLLPVCCLAVPAPHVPSQASRPQLSAHPLAPTLPALPVLPALPSLPNTEGGASFLPSKIMPPINAPAPLMDRGYSLTTSMLAAMQYEAMLKAPAPAGAEIGRGWQAHPPRPPLLLPDVRNRSDQQARECTADGDSSVLGEVVGLCGHVVQVARRRRAWRW